MRQDAVVEVATRIAETLERLEKHFTKKSGRAMTAKFAAVAVVLFLLVFTAPAFAREQPTDAEIRQQIIQESIADYKVTGHPCACPYDFARNGSSCGGEAPTADRA